MKTITEFSASSLQNALKIRQELLATGKTPEELPAAMGEALKLEGDKLGLLLSALEVVEKKSQDLKRVVVWSLQEGENAPRGTEKKGEHHFGVEYFPPMPGQQRGKHGKGRGDRDGDRKRGRKGRGGKGGRRDDRRPRRDGERPAPQGHPMRAAGGAGSSEGQGDAEKKRSRRRRPHGPRKEGAGPQAQTEHKGIITPKNGVIPRKPQPATQEAAAPSTESAGSSENNS